MITNREGLKAEVEKPEYAGKTASEVLALLLAISKTRFRGPVAGSEIIAQLDNTELDGLADATVSKLLDFLSAQQRVNLHDSNVVTLLGKFFPGASPSRANLLTFRDEAVTPLDLAGISGEPTLHQIEVAQGAA